MSQQTASVQGSPAPPLKAFKRILEIGDYVSGSVRCMIEKGIEVHFSAKALFDEVRKEIEKRKTLLAGSHCTYEAEWAYDMRELLGSMCETLERLTDRKLLDNVFRFVSLKTDYPGGWEAWKRDRDLVLKKQASVLEEQRRISDHFKEKLDKAQKQIEALSDGRLSDRKRRQIQVQCEKLKAEQCRIFENRERIIGQCKEELDKFQEDESKYHERFLVELECRQLLNGWQALPSGYVNAFRSIDPAGQINDMGYSPSQMYVLFGKEEFQPTDDCPPKKPTGTRGPDPQYPPEKDKSLLARWKAAKAEGKKRRDFVQSEKITLSEFILAKQREKYRRGRDAE